MFKKYKVEKVIDRENIVGHANILKGILNNWLCNTSHSKFVFYV